MSNFIIPFLINHYEDYERYGGPSCTLKHLPDMWPEEIAAEAALYRERMRQKQQTFFMARDDVHRVIQHFKNLGAPRYTMNDWARQALLSLAEWNGWKVKNGGNVRLHRVTPIIATRHCDDEELEDIENFMKPKQILARIKREKTRIPRKQLVELALLSLIDEQGWQRVGAKNPLSTGHDIYHYKT